MKVAVLLTCHNRLNKTLACLEALYQSPLPEECLLDVVLVDDGSTDGTAAEVARLYPDVRIHLGDGSLFWNRGMFEAQIIALRRDPDYVLWLNDDTVLLPDAIIRLLKTVRQVEVSSRRAAVIVGSILAHDNITATYGGAVSTSRLRRFNYRLVSSDDEAVECDVMNGNLVLIPREIVNALGNIDPEFEHAMGDTDYALRAKRAGFKVFVAAGALGRCDRNPAPEVDYYSAHSLKKKWSTFTSRKRLPPKSWLRFTRRHGGLLWPMYFVQPYAKYLCRSIWFSMMNRIRAL